MNDRSRAIIARVVQIIEDRTFKGAITLHGTNGEIRAWNVSESADADEQPRRRLDKELDSGSRCGV